MSSTISGTTRINVFDKKVLGVMVSSAEVEIGYEAWFCPEEREMGYVREPAHLDIDHIYNTSYVDSEIYFIDEQSDEIELCPKNDRVLFKMAEELIIDWVIENMAETIEDSIHDDHTDDY